MTVLRATAFFMLLLAPPAPEAQAVLFPLQRAQPSAVLTVRHPYYGDQCPRLCTEWFDGCNNCSCGRGRIDVCTQHYCLWRGRPRCIRWGLF